MNLAQAIGRAMRRKREALGYTAKMLGARSGVSMRMIYALEAGHYGHEPGRVLGSPRLDTISAVAAALGCSVSELVGSAETIQRGRETLPEAV